MAFKLPWSNFHELNLDWILEKVKDLDEKVSGIIGSADPSNDPPLMDGAASAGVSDNYARGDHVHPTDTSRASQLYAQSIENKVDSLEHDTDVAIREINDILNFSTAAPLVDGIANPGNSQYPARADHVHPTDTSRASQSDFDTLKSRVDGMGGLADPSNAIPQMNGVGAPGNTNNYSRGDHVHPSDTSKLDIAGGHVDGPLLQKAQTVFFSNTGVGWKRVASIPNQDGTLVDIHIERTTSGIEVHSMTLMIVNGAQIVNEVSKAATQRIDKVRYTNAGGLDIHFTTAPACDVSVTIVPYASVEANWTAARVNQAPELVADSPDGETVLSTLTLSNNTLGQPSWPVLNNSLAVGQRRAVRMGNIAMYLLYIHPNGSSVSLPVNTVIATGMLTPKDAGGWFVYGMIQATGEVILMRVTASGDLTVATASSLAATDNLIINAIYPIKEG